MTKRIEGIVPVMLTPFTETGEVDFPGLKRLIEWYLANGSDGLFSVCQSSEMQYLSLDERAKIGQFVVKQVAGRVPVVVSGHISDDIEAQVEELTVAANTGADAVVLVTKSSGSEKGRQQNFPRHPRYTPRTLPANVPLGLTNVRRLIAVC